MLLHDLAERCAGRALVIVISDFFCELEPLLNCFQHLRFQKHDLALFQLLDRAEVEFQFDRPVRFVDLESSLSIVTEPSSIRDEYLSQLENISRATCATAAIEIRGRLPADHHRSKL